MKGLQMYLHRVSFTLGLALGMLASSALCSLVVFFGSFSKIPDTGYLMNPELRPIPSKKDEIYIITQDVGHLERAFICMAYDGAFAYRLGVDRHRIAPTELELLALEEFKLAQQGYNELKL
jgi:hypothetical protein